MVLEGYGNEADKFNGSRSTGQGQQHGGRPLDFEGNVNANRSGSGDRDANGSASHRPWKDFRHVISNVFLFLYLGPKAKGGGATRVAEHLGGIVGNVRSCPNVPRNVRDAMRKCRDESKRKKRDKQNSRLRIERNIMEGLYQQGGVINVLDDDEEEIQMNIREALRDRNVSRRVERRIGREGVGDVRVSVGKRSITAYFDKQLSSNKVSMQPKISSALNPNSRDALGLAWSKFFHANDIARLKADCPYFRAAVKITQQLGRIPIPTGKEIDGQYLEANYDEANLFLQKFKQDWKNFGVTLMCDSWTGPTGMSIINFMVYCNTRMFFLNTIDASGQTQNSDFIYKEIEKVVEEIGHEHIVQIVTDNGSNYKKARKTLIEEPKYSHIVWQPCAAHTVNLMLKDIAKSLEVDVIVKSAKTICRFMHKHNNLHDNMKKNIGGELIRPNATRFGTVFMFLDSYHSKKDKFREWMVSKDWKECQWRYEPGYVFAEECLSSNVWWNALEWVLGSLRPLYMAMRYVDTQKQCTLSGFKKRMMLAIQKMEAHLGPTSRLYLTFMRKVGKRIDAMEEDTFMVAAAVLDPYTHYKLNLCDHTDYATSLTDAIAKILDPVSALSAIDEVRKFRECQGRFGTRLAEEAAARMEPTQWCFQFGGDVPALQKCAMRIFSQCISSSGCERNWSAFSLVHTKQRNRMLYDKLDKLVSVHYNLKIRAEEDEGKERDIDKEIDPSALLMDTTMFDETNPIMEWLNEDVEDPIMDGADAASAVFEKIRHLNSSRKASYVGSKGSNKKRKRSDDDENEFVETESEDDDGENEYVDNDMEDDDAVSEDDEDGLQDQLETQMQLEEETQVQVEKDTTSIGNLETRRCGRLARKKTKHVHSLYS
ncbi:hypothetical protein D1007_56553 [Hordeum vulgare]|nr:hypothetical protein D1007_56553 [Hordeum vulgare]